MREDYFTQNPGKLGHTPIHTPPPIALLRYRTFLVKWVEGCGSGTVRRSRYWSFSPIYIYVMQINIATRHGEIGDAAKEKIVQKVEKLLRFFDRLTSIDVTVDLEKADEPNMEVAIKSERRNEFVASYKSNDMFGSLDQVVSKLEQQIKKHKEKLQERGKNVPADV